MLRTRCAGLIAQDSLLSTLLNTHAGAVLPCRAMRAPLIVASMVVTTLFLAGCGKLNLGVALWHGGLPVDVLPASGFLEIALGEEHYGWPAK